MYDSFLYLYDLLADHHRIVHNSFNMSVLEKIEVPFFGATVTPTVTPLIWNTTQDSQNTGLGKT
jgi:hypothetical protein